MIYVQAAKLKPTDFEEEFERLRASGELVGTMTVAGMPREIRSAATRDVCTSARRSHLRAALDIAV